MNIFKTASLIALSVIFTVPSLRLVADDPVVYRESSSVVAEEGNEIRPPATTSLQAINNSSMPDIMDTRNNRLIDYRRMFKHGRTPTPAELQGMWRGVNKGIVTLVGYKQFVKEIQPCGSILIGDNIQVHQVSNDMLRCFGWQPKIQTDGQIERLGKFVVKPPKSSTRLGHRRLSPFAHGAEISYRDGGNDPHDPVRLLVDRIVMIDDNHVLGRATAKFGLVQIPLAYFVLERIQ